MDAYEVYQPERHERLKTKMTDVMNVQYRIMCVPAYIETTQPSFCSIHNSYRVVANSASRVEFPQSPGSFIERIDEQGSACRLVQLEKADNPTCIKLYPLSLQEA
jgi:hypothetical protein